MRPMIPTSFMKGSGIMGLAESEALMHRPGFSSKLLVSVAALIAAAGLGTVDYGGNNGRKSRGPRSSGRRRKFKGYQRQQGRRK